MTTQEAATALHVSTRRVLKLIANGRLPAVKHGRDWLIEKTAVSTYTPGKNGRPRLTPAPPTEK